MIFFVLALVVAASGTYASSPVVRSGVHGAAQGYWSGHRASVRADRTARQAARTLARTKKLNYWKSKKSGPAGTAKYWAWTGGAAMLSPVRSHGKAVRSGLRETRTGWSDGVKRAREIKAGRHPAPTESDQPLGPPAPTTSQWQQITPEVTPEANPAPTEGEKSMTVSTEIIDLPSQIAALRSHLDRVEPWQAEVNALSEQVLAAEFGSETVDRAVASMAEQVSSALNTILEAITGALSASESLQAKMRDQASDVYGDVKKMAVDA